MSQLAPPPRQRPAPASQQLQSPAEPRPLPASAGSPQCSPSGIQETPKPTTKTPPPEKVRSNTVICRSVRAQWALQTPISPVQARVRRELLPTTAASANPPHLCPSSPQESDRPAHTSNASPPPAPLPPGPAPTANSPPSLSIRSIAAAILHPNPQNVRRSNVPSRASTLSLPSLRWNQYFRAVRSSGKRRRPGFEAPGSPPPSHLHTNQAAIHSWNRLRK